MGVLDRAYGGCAGNVVEQRYFAESLSAGESSQFEPVVEDGDGAVADRVVLIAGVSLFEDVISRANYHLLAFAGERLERGCGQRSENGNAPQKRHLDHRDRRVGIDEAQTPGRRRDHDRGDRGETDEGCACAADRDQKWGDEGADGQSHVTDALHQREDMDEDVERRRALQQGLGRDGLDSPGGADDHEQRDCDGCGSGSRQCGECGTSTQRGGHQDRGEAASHEPRGDHAADQAACPERCREIAGCAWADRENLHGQHDDEEVHGPLDGSGAARERRQGSRRRLRGDDSDRLDDAGNVVRLLVEIVGVCLLGSTGGCDEGPGQDADRCEHDHGCRWATGRQEHAGEARPGERAHAVGPGRCDVRGGELLGDAHRGRKEGRVHRARRTERHRIDDRRQGDDRQRRTGRDKGCLRGERKRLNRIAEDETPPQAQARQPARQSRAERDAREQPGESDQACCRRPSSRIRNDEQRDPRAVLDQDDNEVRGDKPPECWHPGLPKNDLGYTHRDYEGKVSTLCAGCGHDSITASIIEACFHFSIEPHRVAKFSGIGCSSKTPDYFLGNSHGFNSVHGRMPSVLTGANLANRDLIYLGVSGDGDRPRSVSASSRMPSGAA